MFYKLLMGSLCVDEKLSVACAPGKLKCIFTILVKLFLFSVSYSVLSCQDSPCLPYMGFSALTYEGLSGLSGACHVVLVNFNI